ncbi:MAG: aldehyde dehydrogenase family protein [Pseudomonadota bacterium]|nr:aldehyde dehydrogenase family protein [Pseudomonadota bacterium]
MADLTSFATLDPVNGMNEQNPGKVLNLVNGKWTKTSKLRKDIPDPLSGNYFLDIPETEQFLDFIKSFDSCPKSGMHNPLKNIERYLMLGEVCTKASELMREREIEEFFCRLIQRVMPKSYKQCLGEVTVTRVFLENFSGDNVRFLARSFSNPGDHLGQESSGYRWPFGAVSVIAPFNFPLEIPALQALGALFMGNRPLVKVDSKVSAVFEQFIRLLISCGLPPNDLDFINCKGEVMGDLIKQSKDKLRLVQFTGSREVAEKIAIETKGKIKIEDAGFDWKIIGPDYDQEWLDHVAWQCDEDAYNASGQKCSAQSLLFIHKNWEENLIPRLKQLALKRELEDLNIGPVLTWSNQQLLAHIDSLLKISGAECLFGGKELTNHSIPQIYGSIQPTAIKIPIGKLLGKNFNQITKEVFGPFQVIIVYEDNDLDIVKECLEQISQNLTAAIVSNDIYFQQEILANTINGTTYTGMLARTTGAPQNHWFGPSGDPRSAGIGTPEAIINTWSGHREIIKDVGPLSSK